MTAERYARSAIFLHWAIASLLLFQLGLGWRMDDLGQGGTMFAAFQLHKSIGISILVLSVLRIGVRFAKARPADVKTGPLTALVVKGVHFGLYVFMIAAPLTGWAVVSTAKISVPTRLFGVIPWPHLPIERSWHGLAEDGHEVLAWIGVTLFALHVAGAIRHHLGKGSHENVIGRMIPAVSSESAARRAVPAALAAVALLGLVALTPWLLYRTEPASSAAAIEVSATEAAPTEAVPAAVSAEATEPVEAAATEEPTEAAASEAAQPVAWRVLDGGRLGFVASMNGAAIVGRFEKWSADILFDPEALPQSRITVRVPLLSANTDDADRDSMLKGPEFFGNAGTAVYRSGRITHLGGDRYSAAGTLTMNGVSRPATLAFTLRIDGDKASVSGSTKLDRTSFGIGSGQWAGTDQIAGGVDVNFTFSARKAP